MRRRSRLAGLQREKLKKQRKVQQAKGRSAHQSAHLSGSGQLSRVMDDRFGLDARHASALDLGSMIGNRNMLGLIGADNANVGAVQLSVIQRGMFDEIMESVGSKFNEVMGLDPEGAVKALNSKLKRASKILDHLASTTVDNPELRKKLIKAKKGIENLQKVTSGILKALDARDKISKVWELVSALQQIPDDIASNPEEAAEAFGKVFSTSGELGQMLPDGPWTPYFEFLGAAGSFFSDMLYGLQIEKMPKHRDPTNEAALEDKNILIYGEGYKEQEWYKNATKK